MKSNLNLSMKNLNTQLNSLAKKKKKLMSSSRKRSSKKSQKTLSRKNCSAKSKRKCLKKLMKYQRLNSPSTLCKACRMKMKSIKS